MPFEYGPAGRLVLIRRDADTFELGEPITYRGEVDTWTVPVGFVTDLTSVPRWAVWLIPRFSTWTMAAVLHDWFCEPEQIPAVISAVDADGVFRRVMGELGVSKPRRWVMWAGVRWGALTNPYRRGGWLTTLPQLLRVSVAAAPVVLLGAVPVMVASRIADAIERATGHPGASDKVA